MKVAEQPAVALRMFCRKRRLGMFATLRTWVSFFAGNAAGVAKGIQDQSATNQLQIRFKNFFAQFGEKHQSLAEVTQLCFEGDRLPSVVTI